MGAGRPSCCSESGSQISQVRVTFSRLHFQAVSILWFCSSQDAIKGSTLQAPAVELDCGSLRLPLVFAAIFSPLKQRQHIMNGHPGTWKDFVVLELIEWLDMSRATSKLDRPSTPPNISPCTLYLA